MAVVYHYFKAYSQVILKKKYRPANGRGKTTQPFIFAIFAFALLILYLNTKRASEYSVL